jgi:hypothetical protein
LIAICCELFSYFEEQNDEKSMPIREQLKSIVSIFGDLSNQFLKAQIGIDVENTFNKNKSINHGKVIFEKFNQKKDLFEKLYKSIAEYTAEKQLIILIDELDRTRPDYAVNFLETLKHFFDIKGLIFILAVNKEQLKQSVECIYGKIDFDEYYRKFAHRDVALPYSEEGINKYIIKIVDDFFTKIEVDGKKIEIEKNSLKNNHTLRAYMDEFFTKLRLSPRQINQFFRVFLSLLTSENKSSITFAYQIASIVYIAIDLYDSEIAKKILNDQFKYIDFLDFTKSKKIDFLDFTKSKIIDLPTRVRLVSYLLFLFSNTREEVNQNIKIYEDNFGVKIGIAHESELDLGGFNEGTISPIKNVGKKISQSKKLFGQS